MATDKNRAIVANYEEISRVSPFDILSTGRYSNSGFGYANRLGRFLADEMELQPSDRILDAGCNVGIYHPMLASRAGTVLGIDASESAIARARARNKNQKNVEYRVADFTALKRGEFAHHFDKILCYSVIHFLGDYNELESLMRSFVELLEGGHGTIFLGEVRERELYERFQKDLCASKGSRLRDLKFALLKKLQGWLLRAGTFREGMAPTLFSRHEIEVLATRLGARQCERIEQASWHPFHNTCADYRLRF